MGNSHGTHGSNTHHHHIVPTPVAMTVGGTLLVLTAVTVWVAHIDLGPLNFVVAMLVATVKALLVMMFFMNLLYDRRENSVIFATSFLFLAIFITLTSTDIFFRGDVYVPAGTPLIAEAKGAKSKFKDPWISTPELVAHGATVFKTNCVSCHGEAGHGDGPASGAYNPKPRNFTQNEGWKNGRKPSMVFKTLKEGLPGTGMASWASLSLDDRWGVAHYVLSLGPQPVAKDTAEDYKVAGVDLSGAAEKVQPTIPVKMAMAKMTAPDPVPMKGSDQMHFMSASDSESSGARIYRMSCASCHGPKGEGMMVSRVGGYPKIMVQTQPLAKTVASADAFGKIVLRGIPGSLMPGSGSLSTNDLRELYQYVQTLR